MSHIASALDFLADKKILHRDVKPANILMSYDPSHKKLPSVAEITFKLADFNLSRIKSDGIPQTDNVGSYMYMALEVMEPGRPYDSRADVYSFGVVVFESLTDTYVFKNPKDAIRIKNELRNQEKFEETWMKKLPQGLTDDFKTLLAAMLKTDYTKRITPKDLAQHRLVKLDDTVESAPQEAAAAESGNSSGNSQPERPKKRCVFL